MFQLSDALQRIPARWWRTAFWLVWATTTTLMVLPAEDLPVVDIWDKAEHAGTFFALMMLAWLGYRHGVAPTTLALWLTGYGIAMECFQFFIPSRSFSVLDMVADTTGILPVWWLATRMKHG